MRRDCVYDVNEINIAKKTIKRYSDFLIESINKYLALMEDTGINDDNICKQINILLSKVKICSNNIAVQTSNIDTDITSMLKNVENLDDFTFPEDIMTMVKSGISDVF